MAQLDTITLGSTDFTPTAQDGTRQILRAAGASYQLGQQLSLKEKAVSNTTRTRTVQILLDFPETYTDLNQKTSVIRSTVSCLFTIPVAATTANITTLRGQMVAALANAIIVDAVDNGHNPY